MPRNDVILWLDLETTGSSDDAAVLEVGMALTGPGPKFEMLDSFMELIRPEGNFYPTMNDFVFNMHTKNGLLDDLQVHGKSMHDASTRMAEKIGEWFGISNEHVILAGSGVGHFDRKFVKRDWPWLDKRLAYYTYDVGVLRRFCRMVGIEAGVDQSLTPHRALADVHQHIREARTLLEKIKP